MSNLLSELEIITDNGADYVRPRDDTDGLLIGYDPHTSLLTGAFDGAAALFNGDPAGSNGGTNYYGNIGYGLSFVPLGGVYLGARARGTPSSPTAVQAGDWLGAYSAVGYDGSTWAISGSNHVLPAVWFQAAATPVSGSESIEQDIYIGGLQTKMIGFETDTNAIKFNEALFDSDISFYWDSGTSLSQDGATGNWTFSQDVQIDGTLTVGTAPTYTATNGTVDRSFDADSVTLNELADIVYTMIADLQTIGLFQ